MTLLDAFELFGAACGIGSLVYILFTRYYG